jgi:hypothetical protein
MRKLMLVPLFHPIESLVTCTLAQLQPEWIRLDTEINEESVGEIDPLGNIMDLYFYSDGVCAYFNLIPEETPNANAFTYMAIF